MAFSEAKAESEDRCKVYPVGLRMRPVATGVMRTTARTKDRQVLEAAARARLGSAAVLIRWEWNGRDQLTIWWATGPSNVLALASCSEMAGDGTVFEAEGDTLVIHTSSPHIWVGKVGWRVRALQEIWGVPVQVQNANAVRCLTVASATTANENCPQPKLGWLQRLAAKLIPVQPAS